MTPYEMFKFKYSINSASAIRPAVKKGRANWGDGFPWIAKFLDVFFPEIVPQVTFLGWLQDIYLQVLLRNERPDLELNPGQVLIVAGEPGRGKTLLSSVIVSRLLGGHSDISAYFVGQESFCGSFAEKNLVTVDDVVPTTTRLRRKQYSDMVKKLTAGGPHAKKHVGQFIWNGRVFVTCNVDPESLQILPVLDASVVDKIIVLRCNSEPKFPFKFPKYATLSNRIHRELPFFGRFLDKWDIPKTVRGQGPWRCFPVRAYQDPTLLYAMK